MRQEKGYHYLIEMDGSSSRKTFKCIDQANPDIYVIGRSGLFAVTDNIEESWARMCQDYQDMTGKTVE